MTHFYDYPQTVKLVNGLNSVSTLKKWRLKIERLTGHAFEESRVRTGKRSSLLIVTLSSCNRSPI